MVKNIIANISGKVFIQGSKEVWCKRINNTLIDILLTLQKGQRKPEEDMRQKESNSMLGNVPESGDARVPFVATEKWVPRAMAATKNRCIFLIFTYTSVVNNYQGLPHIEALYKLNQTKPINHFHIQWPNSSLICHKKESTKIP